MIICNLETSILSVAARRPGIFRNKDYLSYYQSQIKNGLIFL
jgi:hypothetical protein